MTFFLYEKLERDSPLTISELKNRLQEKVEFNLSLSSALYDNSEKPFHGKIKLGYFKLVKTYRRNDAPHAILPIVVGRYFPIENGSKLLMKLRLNYAVYLILIVPICILLVTQDMWSQDGVLSAWQKYLFLLFMVVFFIGVAIQFHMEVKKVKAMLDDIFEE